MSAGARILGLAAFLPYGAAALLPALSPARALALGWILEAARPEAAPPRSDRRRRIAFLLGHGAAWLALHALRPDAAAWRGLLLLALAGATLPAWRRPGRWGWLVPAALLVPTLLTALLALGERQLPQAAARAVPWAALAAPPLAAPFAAPPALPAGVALAGLDLVPPPELQPRPLEDSPLRGRAWTLVALLAAWQLGLAFTRPPWRARLRAGGLLLAGAALLLARPPDRLELRYEDASGSWMLELRQGAGEWDPVQGPLLRPAGSFALEAGADGKIRVGTGRCWGVARRLPAESPGPGPASAWLEVHPLRAPRSGGPAATEGGLGLLRWWAAGESGGEAARWELGEDGRLFRRPL